MICLRDMIPSDIEDYVRWFTTETEWMDWDAPWEWEETTEEAERKDWTEYYETVKKLPPDAPRKKFEIELDGRHVGWVSRYFDLGYLDNPEQIPAVGINIVEQNTRNHGVGTEALRHGDRIHQREMGLPVIRVDHMGGGIFQQMPERTVQHGSKEFAVRMVTVLIAVRVKINHHQLVIGCVLQLFNQFFLRRAGDQGF